MNVTNTGFGSIWYPPFSHNSGLSNPFMMIRAFMQLLHRIMGQFGNQRGGHYCAPGMNPHFGRPNNCGHSRPDYHSSFLGNTSGHCSQACNGSHHHEPDFGRWNGTLHPRAHCTPASGAFGSEVVSGRNSMKKGVIVLKDPQTGEVLGQYKFRNGGKGRGSIPWGEYEISRGRRRRNRAMSSDGFGYSFDLTQKGMPHGTALDPKYNTLRSLLRVHPDGGTPGTMGCIGIVGGAQVQKDFYQKAMALQQKYGGTFSLSFVPS